MRKYTLLIIVAVGLAMESFAQRQEDMRQAVEYLASQELGGRFPGSKGDTLASTFIVEKLRQLKLKPVVKAKKEKAFFQDFTYGKTEKKVTTHNIIAVIPGKDKRLKHEYIVVGSHYDHLGMGGMPWCSNWPSISRRHARPEASSSCSSEQRSRASSVRSSSWNG